MEVDNELTYRNQKYVMILSQEHKDKIAASLSVETPELVERICELRDRLPLRQIAKEINIGYATLCRIIKRHNIKLSDEGRRRASDATRRVHLGKTPWNKGKVLSNETKAKISQAVSGEYNGQYGRGMTDDEKIKWRKAYWTEGIIKMRAWLESEAGQLALQRSITATTTDGFRQDCSNRTCELVRRGKLKYRGKGKKVVTSKGGKFRTKSTYETRFVELLEADPAVVRFVYEPFKIPYQYNGKKKHYIPDFLVKYNDGREELIEVKPKKLLSLSINEAKINAGNDYHPIFRVVTEDDLPGL